MSEIADQEADYVRWQNRAFRFYAGSRLLVRHGFYAPGAYSAAIAIELLLKATLIYLDRDFDPITAGHGIAKMVRMVRKKAENADRFTIPEYFYFEKRYLNVSRYPLNEKGFLVPPSFLEDIDRVFSELILLVPFQHNTELVRSLSGSDQKSLKVLRTGNRQIRKLRRTLLR